MAISAATLAAQADVASKWNDEGLRAAAHADYASAERWYGAALAKWRELGSAYSAHAAATLTNLGEILCNQGRLSEGTQALEEALELHRRALGENHAHTVRNLSLLGQAYVLAGDTGRAETVLAGALATERELYPGDEMLGQTLLAMASLRRVQGKLDEALQFGEEALAESVRAGGELSTSAAMAYENVAVIHRLAGRPERALPLFRKARFLYQRTVGAQSPVFQSLLSEEGLALLDEGDLILSEQDLLQAVNGLAKLGPSCDDRRAIAETNLGLVRLRQRKLGEAERLLTDALSIEERLPSRPVLDMAATLGVLAQLRKAQRRDAESAQLTSRAAAIQTDH
jgi:tetratricopeptide (TPR) repeat protein